MSDFRLERIGVVPQRGPGPGVWRSLTVLLAVACAVLSFLLVRAQAEDGLGPTRSAESTAALACRVLAEIEPDGIVDPARADGYLALSRLSLATELAWLAFLQDDSYGAWRAEVEAPRFEFAQTFSPDSVEFTRALDQAREACADLPHA
ncbi:hypothetical protein [Ornithinimicrobium cavernae]|uniref:hypothetical protein n=1 Tax=Ornithinimicrobium cavernae TaxID=2666047 RepID=UPI000D69202B|nr:hypothetical protein [Ornithinimicrobium cavernae]